MVEDKEAMEESWVKTYSLAAGRDLLYLFLFLIPRVDKKMYNEGKSNGK